MSEYGIRITNYQAGSIYEVSCGVREMYDMKPAMLINSLFKDFMVQHGMEVTKQGSTRDIIGVDFKYGSRTYIEEARHLKKLIKETETGNRSEEEKKERLERLHQLAEKVEANKDKFDKKTRSELRVIFYTQGIDIRYPIFEDKKVVDHEIIHYRMLYRTPGKAKKGSCMFIREELYDIARDYLYMGIKLPEENAPIVEIGAYSSLITSSIVGKIQIDPHDILILNDYDSFYETTVVSIETDEEKHCHAIQRQNYKLKNTMFDGQALIDSSIFPDWADGYVLLREHFCKMAAFCTNIQLFFKDHYGDQYETAEIEDAFGNKHKAKDIKLITTTNAVKFIKFDVSYDYWCDRVKQDNDNYFGIVKTAHKSKLGEVQQMSYQMINAMDIDTMNEVLNVTTDYLDKLTDDNEEFLKYLEKNKNFSNDYEVLIALVKQDPDFIRSEYFKERRSKIIVNWIQSVKLGKVINHGDNLVIVGSPYAMLMWTVGLNPEDDPSFEQEDGCIQCYTGRFEDGEYLAEFRSPFNSRNNLGYLHNHYSQEINRYFNLGKQIIAINMRHTDFQSRNNGSDQDSDTLYVTNNEAIARHARYCYLNYPTIENNIPKEKNKYNNTLEDFATIDNRLAESQMTIGVSSNLAQICLSYSYNFDDQKYKDYVCILSVLAQVAIDNSKRRFDINLNQEINRIKADMDIGTHGYPLFWKQVKSKNDLRQGIKLTSEQKKEREGLYNSDLICPMNYVGTHMRRNGRGKPQIHTKTIPMTKFFVYFNTNPKKKKRNQQVEKIIEKYALTLTKNYNAPNLVDNPDNNQSDYFLLREDFDEMIEEIRRVNLSNRYRDLMSWLINRAFGGLTTRTRNKIVDSKLQRNRSILLKTLYSLNPEALLECFSGNLKKS